MSANPFQDFNPMFSYYKNSEPEVITRKDALFGSVSAPDGFFWSSSGNLVPRTAQQQEEKDNSNHLDILEPINFNQTHSSNNFENISLKGSENLSKIIDEVSNEEGFEELKNPNIKKLILLQAKRESSFNPTAKSKSSSASGYFQFIDGTRKKYSNYSKEEFLKDQKEQVRAAYKYFSDIHKSSSALKLKQQGYNDAFITALGWWYPRSMDMVLEGKKDFSLGGYSIKKAMEDYG